MLEVDFELGLCAVCKKKPVTQFCDYILEYHNDIIFIRDRKLFNDINRRGEQYETCDLPMCRDCAKEISIDHDLCPYHYGLYLKRKLPDTHHRKRRAEARGYIGRRLSP